MPLSVNNATCLDVTGEMTLDTAARLFEDSRALFPGDIETVNLEGVSRVDSAGLALLLEWQASARKRGSELRFESAPKDLLSLAALCEATGLLGIEAPDRGSA